MPNATIRNLNQTEPQLTITFKDNIANQVAVTNQNAMHLFPCYSANSIGVGNTMDQIRGQCGPPSFINTSQQSGGETVRITEWTYNFGSFKPVMIFTFQDGKLTQIRMGQIAK